VKHNPGFLQLVNAVRPRVTHTDPAAVKARLDRHETFHFIDVREDGEWAVDHAAGARHIGRGVLERDIETLLPDREADIVLYCGGGYRSTLAADSLQQMGYRRVASMEGGMRAWREAGYPLETGQ
jgi:rhodanese-related sulfurtransferase